MTQTTKADGKYRIAIPKGNIQYSISITKPVTIGDEQIDITINKKVEVGEVGKGGSNEVYNPSKSATGIVVQQDKDGSSNIVKDLSSAGMELKVKV